MALGDNERRLLRRADNALGPHKVADAVAKVRAIVGPDNIPDSEPLAQSALEKLRNGERPTAEELMALEIVVRLLRPVVYSRQGYLDDLPDQGGHNLYPDKWRIAWRKFREDSKPFLDSVGKIEIKSGRKHIGSGFLVRDGLIATNRHVLAALSFGAEALPAGFAQIVFREEKGIEVKDEDIVPIIGIDKVHPELDMVLLKVPPQQRSNLTISDTPAEEGDLVVAVGYPGEDRANNPIFLSGVFGPKFGIRRASLGEVMDGRRPPHLNHDCSTTQGNSGSPLLALKNAEVVGIHSAGGFMYRNEAIDAAALKAFVS